MEQTFGELIEYHRAKAGLTQAELATAAGVSRGIIVRAEQDHVTRDNARQIIRALHSKKSFARRRIRELAEVFVIPSDVRNGVPDPKVIGLIVPDSYRNSFWVKVVGSIERRADESDCLVLPLRHDEDFARQVHCLRHLEHALSLSGLIMAPALGRQRGADVDLHIYELERELRKLQEERNFPVVFIDRHAPERVHRPFQLSIPWVGPDNQLAARSAVEYLLAAGHTRVALLCDYPETARHYQERLAGYRQAIEQNDLTYDSDLVLFGNAGKDLAGMDWSGQTKSAQDGARTLASHLLTLVWERRVTAALCANHEYALAIHALSAQEGITIPGDLSLIGFDDVPEYDRVSPRITHVGYSIDKLAEVAFSKVIELLKDTPEPQAFDDSLIADDVFIVIGQSVGPPP